MALALALTFCTGALSRQSLNKDVAPTNAIDMIDEVIRALAQKGLKEGKTCDHIKHELEEKAPGLRSDEIFQDMFPKACRIEDLKRIIELERTHDDRRYEIIRTPVIPNISLFDR